MKFTKGHGTGNDFVILPDPEGELPLTPELVAALCDRRRGIGGDGVLRIVRAANHPESADHAGDADWFMDYWNADGSFAEMCGNGIRVFVRYLVESGMIDLPSEALPIVTRAGMVYATLQDDIIAVRMNAPKIGDPAVSEIGSQQFPGIAVNCGNPHLTCRVADLETLQGLDLTHSPGYDADLFPQGVNVEFFVGDAERVHMRVFERGAAETLSCGSGALAVGAVVLRESGMQSGTAIIDVPGGRLTVTLDNDIWWLSGPAVLVASGDIDIDALRNERAVAPVLHEA